MSKCQIPSELTENTDGVIQLFVSRSSSRSNAVRSETIRVRSSIETIGCFLQKIQQALISSQQAFREAIKSELNIDSYNTPYNWFDQGVDCEILKLGSSNWQKGKLKIRVSIEFSSEEETSEQRESQDFQSESPLDEIRRLTPID